MATSTTNSVAPTHRAAVLGHPIAHSLSPVLHAAAYRALGLDRLGWQYTAVDMTSPALPDFIDSLGAEWAGLSLTMPLKESVLPLLDEVEPDAAAVRAVNTVVFDGANVFDGAKRRGYNTDITGLVGIVSQAGVTGGTATVLGAGATARSAVAALARCGVRHVVAVARRREAAQEIVDLAATFDTSAVVGGWPANDRDLSSDVVINTVAAGAVSSLAPPAAPALLVDVLYDPWPTPLATVWDKAGGRVIGGLDLLVRQAVEQVALMTGRRPDMDAMRTAGLAALDARAGA